MSRSKIKKFAEMETLPNVFQLSYNDILNHGAKFGMKGEWGTRYFGNGSPIVLELGCGKGEYAVGLAKRFPDRNFIGIDIKGSRMWTGAKEAFNTGMRNCAFLRTGINAIPHFFAPGEVDEIWITFADPQERKPKKRLTHPLFLNRYKKFLVREGTVNLKTDSRLLHYFTLELARQNGMTVIEHNDDIYGSGRADDLLSIKTFYEANFLAQGIPITYLAFHIDNAAPLVEPQWDQEPYEQKYKTLTRADGHVASQLD